MNLHLTPAEARSINASWQKATIVCRRSLIRDFWWPKNDSIIDQKTAQGAVDIIRDYLKSALWEYVFALLEAESLVALPENDLNALRTKVLDLCAAEAEHLAKYAAWMVRDKVKAFIPDFELDLLSFIESTLNDHWEAYCLYRERISVLMSIGSIVSEPDLGLAKLSFRYHTGFAVKDLYTSAMRELKKDGLLPRIIDRPIPNKDELLSDTDPNTFIQSKLFNALFFRQLKERDKLTYRAIAESEFVKTSEQSVEDHALGRINLKTAVGPPPSMRN
ncbi:MAG: hypothetical protein ACK5TN_06975 [Acidobacteriota bacterium]